jgi:formylglycine-generating enzyme
MHRRAVVAVVSGAIVLGACTAKTTATGARAVPAASPGRLVVETASAAPSVRPAGSRGDQSQPASDVQSCPLRMILVEGDYCTSVEETCLTWADAPTNKFARCSKFAPSVCAGPRVHKRFCVDQDEYVPPGESLPMSDTSWSQARAVCERQSKRLCKETEWEFACEGEQMLPYPTGYERDPGACNVDRLDLIDPGTGKLRDHREPPSEVDRCRSPFGVRSMSGNVDEWVWRDRTSGEWRSALKGGWWMPARDRCRPATTAHDEHFHGPQTGVRCCANPT